MHPQAQMSTQIWQIMQQLPEHAKPLQSFDLASTKSEDL
jgi:hypothetical protein